MSNRGKFRYLLFMPSFYGLLTFPAFYFLYLTNAFPFEKAELKSHIIFMGAIVFFLASTLFYFPVYQKIIPETHRQRKQLFEKLPGASKFFFLLLFCIGLFGTAKYVLDFSDYFGGIWLFFFFLGSDSAQIRIAAEHHTSVGFQLTYLAWISATIFFSEAKLKNLGRKYYIFSILIFLSNILFIDRTRPITIIFVTAVFLFIIYYDRFRSSILKRIIILSGISFLAIFVIIGEWIGKAVQEGDQYGKTWVPTLFQSAVLYGTTPFGYFNHIVATETYDYNPSRSLYPGQKLLSGLGLAEEPPSQINDFYFIPQPVNVGTFMEPFYRDGGVLYCLIGVIIHTFFFDLLAVLFLKYPTRTGIYALCILCLANFFAFFTPKMNNMPIWIFLFLGVATTVYNRLIVRKNQNSIAITTAR